MITSQMIMKLQDPASNFQGVGYMMINETVCMIRIYLYSFASYFYWDIKILQFVKSTLSLILPP